MCAKGRGESNTRQCLKFAFRGYHPISVTCVHWQLPFIYWLQRHLVPGLTTACVLNWDWLIYYNWQQIGITQFLTHTWSESPYIKIDLPQVMTVGMYVYFIFMKIYTFEFCILFPWKYIWLFSTVHSKFSLYYKIKIMATSIFFHSLSTKFKGL